MATKKPIWESFSEFKARNHLNDFKIIEIAKMYASTNTKCARTALSEAYGISEHVFYKLLDFAVIACLVDKETQDKILLKRINNSCIHGASEGAKKSILHKQKVLELQKEYEAAFKMHLDSFSEETIFKICKDFRDGMAIYQIAKKNKTSSRVIEILLENGLKILFDTYLSVKRKMGK